MHQYFGFIDGAEPCDFFPYGWYLKIRVQYMFGYVPRCVCHHSEDFVLGAHIYLFIYNVLTIIRRNGTEGRALITDKRGYSKTHT